MLYVYIVCICVCLVYIYVNIYIILQYQLYEVYIKKIFYSYMRGWDRRKYCMAKTQAKAKAPKMLLMKKKFTRQKKMRKLHGKPGKLES